MFANLQWNVSEAEQPVVTLTGELDLASVHELECVCLDVSRRSPNIVFDCRDLTFVDSSGLGLLCRLLRHRAIDSIEVRNPAESLVRLLKMTGLDTVLDLTESGRV